MSGRIRTIKPELLEDAVSAGLSETAFRIFVGMILLADDYGNLRAEPQFLLGHIFWMRPPAIPIEQALAELEHLIHFYAINGQRYASIRKWSKHQRVQRPGKARIPAPSESAPTSAGIFSSPSGLISDHRSPITDHRPGSPPAGAPPHACLESPVEPPEPPPLASGFRMRAAAEPPPTAPPPPESSPRPVDEPEPEPEPEPLAASRPTRDRRTRDRGTRQSEAPYLVAAYERGIKAGAGRDHCVDKALIPKLDDFVDKFAPSLRLSETEAWLFAEVKAFAAGVDDEAKRFAGSYTVDGFTKWLNNGRTFPGRNLKPAWGQPEKRQGFEEIAAHGDRPLSELSHRRLVLEKRAKAEQAAAAKALLPAKVAP